MINIARFRPCDFENSRVDVTWGKPRYAAWVIPPVGMGNVQIVDLGDASEIDRQVHELRQRLANDYQRLRQDGEQAVEAEYRAAAKTLSTQLLAPLESILADATKLILSPDGMLWLLPWDALLQSDGSYLIEKVNTRYVLSGRELLYPVLKRSLVTPPVIIANPEYGPLGNAAGTAPDSLLRGLLQGQFPPLAASAAEAAAIRPRVEALVDGSAKVLTRAAATEQAFKDLHRPQVLVMSTHGYFLESKESTTSDQHIGISNPLLQCGLAMAGANRRDHVSDQEDGVLTGLEIVGTDLRGTELVVLSACETGVGKIRIGEGVAGLRHSFQLAGAQSVVSSLWHVSDLETARLMTLFFDRLSKGQTTSDAMHQAQLTRIQSRRERYGAAHPFFWAAFTITTAR